MLAVSSLFSNLGYLPYQEPHENFTGYEPIMLSSEAKIPQTTDRLQPFSSSDLGINGDGSPNLDSPSASNADAAVAKKLNHNASERDRRKKINSLYSFLRNLLPGTDRMKKLSIPVTVSHVLKYVPELQKEVEDLICQKERLLSSISSNSSQFTDPTMKIKINGSSTQIDKDEEEEGPVCAVSANKHGTDGREVMIQISSIHKHKLRGSFSDLLMQLEEDGLVVSHVSSMESSCGRVFYNSHFHQVENTQGINCQALNVKLSSILEKGKRLYAYM